MIDIKKHITKFPENCLFTEDDLFSLVNNRELRRTTFRWALYNLVKEGYISKVGRKLYRKNSLKNFAYSFEVEEENISRLINKEFNNIDINIWGSTLLNKWFNLLIMKKVCDLHTHSTCSDGTLEPEQLLDLAIEKGLSAIALTDHNNIEGIARFIKYAEGKDIDVIGGCEFTTDYQGQELHLLGLFIDENKFDLVRNYLEKTVIAKQKSTKDTIENFQKAGYPVSYEDFVEFSGPGIKNRANICTYLMSKGIVKDRQVAFNTVLKDGGPFYKSPKKLDFVETIDFIHSIGSVAVWAHPLFHVNKERCEEILKAVNTLDGIECYYTTYKDDETAFMLEIAKKYNLIVSGGSDFHGDNKPDTDLRYGYGNLEIPYDCYVALANRKNK